jgi:hypothetical protein
VTTLADLQARVASRYEGLHLPTWPDPHAGMTPPRDEEYSRLTDPARYRIVHARARVWAAALEQELGARPEAISPRGAPDAVAEAFDRGVRLVPPRAGALPLILLERDAPTPAGRTTLSVLEVAVGRAEVVVERQPDCGCDACDSGSSDLLDAVDTIIRRVVGGPFVVLRGSRWHAEWHPDGGSAGSDGRGPDFRASMDLCRRLADGEVVDLPADTEALVGSSWIL